MNMSQIIRARAYLSKLPPAIAGHGGHAVTFAAACRLVEFGIGETEALEILSEWNQNCQPPWTERDLRHKLADAYRRTSPKESFVGIPHRQDWRLRPLGGRSKSCDTAGGDSSVTAARNPGDNVAEGKSKCPITDPSASFFDAPASHAQIHTLATLRGLSVEGVRLDDERGLLRFGMYRHRPAWFILDASQRVAQARRLDGHNWFADVKALNLADSQAAWPVGIGEAQSLPAIALCEGGPDLLAAFHFILAEHRQTDCAPVAILGASQLIHADALPLFAGKRVRIFGHDDAAGARAVERWDAQLADIVADVHAFSLAGLRRADGAPVKDLCDLAAISPDDFAAHRCLWELFDYANLR